MQMTPAFAPPLRSGGSCPAGLKGAAFVVRYPVRQSQGAPSAFGTFPRYAGEGKEGAFAMNLGSPYFATTFCGLVKACLRPSSYSRPM